MEVYFVYPLNSYQEYTKMPKIRIPTIGTLVYYKNNKKHRIGKVTNIFYDYVAMSVNVFINPIIHEATIIQANTKKGIIITEVQNVSKG